MDSLLSLAGNVQKSVLTYLGSDPEESERQRLASEADAFYRQIQGEEAVQNLLSKYRLQLFQVKEVNEELVRRANMCSTRMGRVQQTLTEHAKQMDRFDQLSRPKDLADLGAQLEDMGRQAQEMERHGLQTELAMAELERLTSGRRGNGRGEGVEDGRAQEEDLLGG